MPSLNKRALTGSRPSGSPHLGNYIGAFRPLLDLQRQCETFFFLADFHAFNENPDAKTLERNSLDLIASLVASGFDHEKNCLYTQSAVPQTTELAWLLSCVSPFGLLNRAVAFKDALAKKKEVNVGVFSYPVLMAADILLYDADFVPVGRDQAQHVEITRDLAQRFNHHYGEILKLPEALIRADVPLLPGLDGEKMSSSKGNVIPMFATDKEWKKQVMAITTDSRGLEDVKDPESCSVFGIYKVFASESEQAAMAEAYKKGGYGYGHAKMALLEKIKEHFSPMREKYFALMAQPDDLRHIVFLGSKKARALATAKMQKIQQLCGFIGRGEL